MRVASLRLHRPLPPMTGASRARLSRVALAAILVAGTDHRTPTAPASRAAPSSRARGTTSRTGCGVPAPPGPRAPHAG